MDRAEWVARCRAAVVASYDAEGPTYDADPYPNDTQKRWVARLLESCLPDGVVLDAACGTGRYFAQIVASGRTVVGVDQSAGMVAEAARRGAATRVEQAGLQELTFVDEFDAVMVVDAMENVAPEDWPVVIAALHRAVKPDGLVYLTVEEIPDDEIDAAYAESVSRGLPAVRGEVTEGNVAGYHYYPGRERALSWIAADGLEVVDEDYQPEDGWGYRHLLLRRPK